MRNFILGMVLWGMSIASSNGQGIIKDTSNISEDSIVNIPFGKQLKRNVVGDITVINPAESAKYDNVQGANELINGFVPGLLGSSNIRGLGSPLVVIDGVPNSLSFVNANEIEQISVVKGADASMLYGTQGSNGVILITTKRGKAHKKVIRGTIETGSYRPISYPQYLGSAEYMGLYNEALANDGLPALYSPATIAATKSGTNPVEYPDVNWYNSDLLKNSKPSSRFQTEFSGGNDNAQFYLNLGWVHTGSIMNLGNQSSDRLNLRANIDVKLNSWIKASVDVVSIFGLSSTANGNFFSDASTIRPNAFPALIDTSLVIGQEGLLQSASLVNGKYLVGGTSIYKSNPYGYLNSSFGGYNRGTATQVELNTGLDFDLKSITKGLSYKVNFISGYDYNYTTTVANTYAVYQTNYSSGALAVTKIGVDGNTGVQNISASYLDRKFTLFQSLNYQRVFGNYNAISASIIGFGEMYNTTAPFDYPVLDSSFQERKYAHLGSRFNYVYKNKYIFDFTSSIVSSTKLAPGNRIAFSPSIGLGWVASEENFLKNNTFINFLKFRVSGGIQNTDMNLGYYQYENIYSQTGNGLTWDDGKYSNTGVIVSSAGNTNLFYEKTKEINVGFNSLLFNRIISLDATLFLNYKSNLLAVLNNTIPAFAGGVNALQNYGENKYSGIEAGLNWEKTIVKDFSINIGATMLITKSDIVRTDEIWPEKYQYTAGKSTSAIFGLQAIGLFKDATDIANSPTQEFGPYQPGDIKYKDQNGDGVINSEDAVMVGKSSPSFVGGFSIRLKYKNFTLFAHGTAQSGSDQMYNSPYYQFYGDEKYSVLARNAWTPATASTATYPRLSSLANNNDLQNSSFWLDSYNYVSLDRLQLTYTTNTKFASKIYAKSLNFYVRASNVFDFSKNRDKQQLNIGTEPQYRFFAAGLQIQF